MLTVSLKVVQKIYLDEFPTVCWGSWKQQKIKEGLWLIYIHRKTLQEKTLVMPSGMGQPVSVL